MRERPLCTFCLFFLIFQVIIIRGFQIGKDWKPSMLEQKITEGSVISLSGKVYHKEVKKENLVVYLTAKSYQTRILVYIKQNNPNDEQIRIGNEIKVTGEVAYFDVPRNPGNFDQKFYYQKQGIHGSIFASEYKITNQSSNIWKENLARIRLQWKKLLIQTLGEKNGNTMSAILLGDKSELNSDLKELYQKNGIGHILAISGLHMTFIGLGFYQLLRKHGFSFVSAGLAGIIFLISYTIMIGNGVASMRALVMFIVRIGADMTGRVYDMLTALALAAIVILIWRPLYLYDAGFLLSFGAILGILLIYPVITLKQKKEHGSGFLIKEKIVEGICGSISINLAILPCMLYFYFEFPCYSILLNLLVIPMMSVVLASGVSGAAVYVILPCIGEMILWTCRPVLWIYEKLCEICISLPGSHLIIGQPKMWQMILYYLLLAMMIWILHRKKEKSENTENDRYNYSLKSVGAKYIVSLGSMGALAIAIVCVNWAYLIANRNSITFTMLDVGQGDGLVVQNQYGHAILIDGGSSDVSEVGKYRIEPYLKSKAIGTVDYVFLSHGDLDHYSGIEELLQRQKYGVKIRCLVFPVEEVLDEKLKALAQIATKCGTEIRAIQPQESVTQGAMKLTCLQPDENYQGAIGNASSMVLSLSYKDFDMLLTGDVEGNGEELLQGKLQQYMEKKHIEYEVLKVAHHGSKNSSSKEFLEVLHPQIAFISAGKKNRYGHPHQETLQRLCMIGSEIFSTQECGAITLQTDGRNMNLHEYAKLYIKKLNNMIK